MTHPARKLLVLIMALLSAHGISAAERLPNIDGRSEH
jgi:hypothetical protein